MADILIVLLAIAAALLFDFYNGMNDAANSISTIVATRVLTPRSAVLMAAIGNFSAVFIFGVAVASMIGKGIVQAGAINEYIILAALAGSSAWVITATHKGLPISASHALIGGLIGSALTAKGAGSILTGGVMKVVAFIFIAPILGLMGGLLLMVATLWAFRRSAPAKVNKHFKKLQIASSFLYSLSHGSNDAQKTMGVITLLLFSAGYLNKFEIPLWVTLLSYTTIALGTLIGGWKVVQTMGMKITKLRPVDGFCAESAGGLVILGSTFSGIPVSTTHVISGSIMGVGATKRMSAVRWGMARRIVAAWILTIPIAMAFAAAAYFAITIGLHPCSGAHS